MYNKCNITAASVQVLYARWQLFGHVLILDKDTPARQAMASYFMKNYVIGRSGNFCTIATSLSDEYKTVTGRSIKSIDDYNKIVVVAQNRKDWKEVVESIKEKYIESQEKKDTKEKDAKRAKD